MRKALIIASLAGFAAALPALSYAQTDSGAGGGRDPEKMHQMFDKRFTKADTNGDGKLSKAEAQAGMPRVAKNFDAIDADHDGFVTKAEIGQAMMAQRAAKGGGQ